MLRPATPLSILLFASFVLLLISTISTPIVKGIPLARNDGVNYGVFGWCLDNGQCSGVQVGWNTGNLPKSADTDFNLSPSTRHSLSALLIVHPVAALCNLIVLGLAVAAHLHSPSHSSRYLLGLLILLLPTLLITLLAFLVDILLFVPHLQWAGWIVLASTILITASGVVTCAMRRTLVSRKARKKRIAENAEMSGANFYARQAEEDNKIMNMPSTESKIPMVNGAPGADRLPAFTSYDARRSEERSIDGPSPIEPTSAISPVDNRYYSGQRSRSNSGPRPEGTGQPLHPSRSIEGQPPMPMASRDAYGPPRGGYPPRGAMASRGRGGPPPSPYRGRGGYPPRGRGYYGGPTPPGMIPPGVGRRPPPGYGPAPIVTENGYMGNDDPRNDPYSPSNYGSEAQQGHGGLAYGARAQSPSQRRQSPYGSRAQSPAGGHPLQEMPPAMPPVPDQYGQTHDHRPQTGMTSMTQDSDVLGLVEMQRVRPQIPEQTSDEYIPPRSGWSGDPAAAAPTNNRNRAESVASSRYVEDVDPRFAESTNAPPVPNFDHTQTNRNRIPSLLVPGHNVDDVSPESSSSHLNNRMPRANSDDELHPGARSPVESEISNFTSVSQRPMNPDWQPGHGGEFNSFGPPDRRQQQRKQDALFQGNPDFELPGSGPPRSRGGYRGGYGRGGPPRRPIPPSTLDNFAGDGRYAAAVPSSSGHAGSMREI